MNTWFRKVGMGALALTLAGVLGGCNNGDGGGGGLIRLFFGINGQGNCTQVIVDVNLDDADAIIARDEFDDVQCVLSDALDDAGCDITFTEFQNGDLRAVISGCTIPAVAGLFSCLFEDVDISELQETASAQCSCVQEGCDGTPPVCISLDDDPRSCEDCDNGIDDDDNGLEDCDDPNCFNAPECTGTSTTSTTSTTIPTDSTSTTSTTGPTVTTSTTIPGGDEFNCTIIFRLEDDVTLGSLQYDADYSNSPGFFLGQGGQVECDSLVEGALSAFNDCDTASCPEFAQKEEVLDSGIISVDGYTGPLNLAECTYRTTVEPVASDFQITVTEASDPDLNVISPLPDVVIASIVCEGGPVTTTTVPGPTTTVPGPTTTTLVGPTTTLPPGGDDFTITFNLDSNTGEAGVGALQFTVDYSGATGGFQGSGATVACTNQVSGALFARNDKDLVCSGDEDTVCDADEDCTGVGTCTTELEDLTLGIVSVDGFTAPAPVVICTFNGDAGDPPVAGDFIITIEDSTDPEGNAIDAVVSVDIDPVP